MRTNSWTITCLLVGAVLAPPLGAQAPADMEALEAILEYSLVDNILSGQAMAFSNAVRGVVGTSEDRDLDELDRFVSEEFAPDRMRADVISAMYEASLPIVLEELSRLLTVGAIGQVRDIVDAYDPPETLEAYVQTLQAQPPPEERVVLMAALADAQQAAGFYLLLDESAREGAHQVARALTHGQAAAYEPLAEAVIQSQLQRGFQFAVVSFLHRYRPVEDELVAGATADYQTAAGQWYVENYSLALAESIRLAAMRVRDRLE